MDVKITDASTLQPKDITILNDPDASTITLSDPTTAITIATDALAITTSAEDSNLQDLKNVTITSVANGQLLAYDSSTSKWVNSSSTTGVSSVNTQTGAVVLDTDDIQEDGSPTNKYFTDARARASLSGSTGVTYNSGTGAIAIGQAVGTTDDVTFGEVEGDEFIGNLRGANLMKSSAGEALTKGDVVYISGVSGNTPVVSKADADDSAKMPAVGLANATVSSGNVDVLTFGQITNIDTTQNIGSTWVEGDALYVNTTAGQLTNTPPTGESSLLQKIAKIEKVHATTGLILIQGAGRTNATPNLDNGKIFKGNASNQSVSTTLDTSIVPENTNLYYTDGRVTTRINATDLDAISNVHTATPTDGQVLTWDNSNSYWKPATSSTAPVTSVNSLTGAVSLNSGLIPELTNLYYTDTRARASNSVTKLSATNESNLTYDSSNGTFTFTPCDARAAINVTSNSAGDVSSLSYNSSTGTLTFTPADASTKLPLSGGALTGALTTNSTIDGVDIATRDAVLTTTTTTANAALPKAGGTMSGDIAMGSQKITGLGTPTNNDDATSKTYVDSAVSGGGGAVTSYTNGTDNRVVTSTGANGINGEANFTFDGSNAVISGSAGGLTSPILELVTDNSGYNRPQLMFKDSNADVWSMAGRNQTAPSGQLKYQAGFTLDPNNTHGRTGVTTYAGDYFVGFNKNYADQSAISMDMVVFGANDGFNISAFDDGGGSYGYRPINLIGNEINLMPGGSAVALKSTSDTLSINTNVEISDTVAIKFENSGTLQTQIDVNEISAKGSFLVNVDSDNSGNEEFKIQSAGTDVLSFSRGPGSDAEMTIKGDGLFIKDDGGKTQFSMDMSSAGSTGINVFRTDENKVLALSLKTDDDDDTGNYDGTWSFRQNADEKSMILERTDGATNVDIFEIRDSADVATANPTDIFEFKIPPVLPSFVVASLPTTVVAGAQAFCTNETGGAVNVFFDGTSWRRCTDRAVAS